MYMNQGILLVAVSVLGVTICTDFESCTMDSECHMHALSMALDDPYDYKCCDFSYCQRNCDMCQNDLDCEWYAWVYANGKTECCEGECKTTCLSVGLIVLFFVILPCLGCLLMVGCVVGVIVMIVKASNGSGKGHVVPQTNQTMMIPHQAVPSNQQYAQPYGMANNMGGDPAMYPAPNSYHPQPPVYMPPAPTMNY